MHIYKAFLTGIGNSSHTGIDRLIGMATSEYAEKIGSVGNSSQVGIATTSTY
jgi:hypothetical protein